MTSEHAQGGQGDFGMNVKGGNRYGMDSSGDGIVTFASSAPNLIETYAVSQSSDRSNLWQ